MIAVAKKLNDYLAKIAHKGPFTYHGGEFMFEQRKVFIDTLVAVPAGEDDLSVGDLKAIVQMMEPPPKAEELASIIWRQLFLIIGAKSRHETVWAALAALTDEQKAKIDEDAEAILRQWFLHLTVAITSMEQELERQSNHIKMHAGDTLSLDNEVGTMRQHWLDAESLVTSLRGDVGTLRTALVHAREALEFSLNKRHEKFEPEKFPIFAEIEAAMGVTKP